MGQRSKMIVGFTNAEPMSRSDSPTRERSAMYFQWRWGAHLIVCAAQAVRLARKQVKDKFLHIAPADALAAQRAIYSVNQLTGKIQGWQSVERETKMLDESGTDLSDGPNGMFLIQLHASTPDGVRNKGNRFTFGFTIGGSNGGDNATVVTADEYLERFGDMVSEWRADNEACEALNAALDTLREAEADGFLMSQEEADKLCSTRAEYEEGFSLTTA